MSPYGLAGVSTALFLLAWLFPPDLYTYLVGEQDFMFLDPTVMCFFRLCAGAFVAGVFVSGLSRRVIPAPETSYDAGWIGRLLLPVALASAACLIFLVMFAGKANVVALLSAAQGDLVKAAIHSGETDTGHWVQALPYLTAVLWWAAYRGTQFGLRGQARLFFWAVFAVGCFVDLAACIGTVSRGALMPLVIGLICIYVNRTISNRDIAAGKLLLRGLAFAGALVFCFFALALLRGNLSTQLLSMSLVGYTIASYNRMTAIVGGYMHFMYSGGGAYLALVIVENSSIYHFFSLRHMGVPDAYTLWQSEFLSNFNAGMNKAFIWAGTFGYVFSEIGWFAPAYLGAIGFLTGFVWRAFQRGRVIGLVLYPYFAFWILFWIGSNVMFNAQMLDMLQIAVVLTIYEFFLLPKKRTAPAAVKPDQIQIWQPGLR